MGGFCNFFSSKDNKNWIRAIAFSRQRSIGGGLSRIFIERRRGRGRRTRTPSSPSKGFTKFENLNLNFQRFFRYITTFSNFQILKTVFLNAEFHNEPARYLGYTRDRRKHDRSALTVPAPILACFLFAYQLVCTWDCAASGAC